jgi:hypothetical protein
MMNFRGLELHGKSFWSHEKIERCLDLVKDYKLSALVIHETDFMTEFFFPTEFFNPAAPWAGAPARRGENALHNNMAYFRDILKRAGRKKVDVWIEVKEITFPDEIIEKHPEVMKNGRICPTDPLWEKVIGAKYRDLVRMYPEVKGVIVSAGSPEGRAALSQKKCSCERCRNANLSEWYESILRPMYAVLAPAGMTLAVREFSYNADHQAAISAAMERMPKDVVFCIKVTPHDFYPTFPDNELIATVKDRPKWIEYDTMGQYYGWGVVPCLMGEDIAARFAFARDHGVEGALLRVEWERINDYWSLDGPNRMNLHIAAKAARGEKVEVDDILAVWLAEEKIGYSEVDFDLLMEYLSDTWAFFRGALYVKDFVLNDSSMVPTSIERAWWSMADKHSLAEWFPARRSDLDLDEEKVDRYIGEKTDSLKQIEKWRDRLDNCSAYTPVLEFLRKTISVTERYVRLHLRYGKVCLLAGLADQKGDAMSAGKKKEFEAALSDLEGCAEDNRAWLERSDFPHTLWLLFNPGRCEELVRGGRARIKGEK